MEPILFFEENGRGIRPMPTFEHEMLREIYEQPLALRRTLALYLADNALKPDVAALLAGWAIPEGRDSDCRLRLQPP